ncbi:hypothetical protein SISNIDRAFT_447770 [Sistotremastrum niveocremeum HHB9708]|uniref:Cupredoxin n=2 Tax=Sistotremastraceae TaxID=3402574 RepID=A0A165AG42_9AGAM|nr:hypothetical protein SISNIDRAFT_447770 [Sistotremastrum niveocremeum HHB9708]KZT44171.1 hypothetical protein SISSUDRAFT_1057160 [Sistotremastrum suecicum HHB10207 ss-3]
MRFAVASALLLPAFVAASPQYGYAPPSGPSDSSSGGSTPATTSSAPVPTPSLANQQIIQVFPGGNFTFTPQSITANENDTITFVFPPGPITHSVTQSNFASPCNLLNENNTSTAQVGFDSGLTSGSEFSIVITNASQPIWFHCKQFGPPSHCGSGMVGAINAPTNGTNTFSAFLAAASAEGANFPLDSATGGLVGLGATATASAGPIPTGSSSSSSSSGAMNLVAGAASGLIAVFSAMVVLM